MFSFLPSTVFTPRIRAAFQRVSFPAFTIPAALLILIFLSFGIRALSMGFFWDDWPYVWIFHSLGSGGIVQAFTGDRPFLSFLYSLSLGLLGNSTLGWQVFALLARWLCSLGLYTSLALAWPAQRHKVFWAAALFAVYPGFTQQWIAVIYGQAFILFAALFFSITLTLWLARYPHRLRRWLLPGTLAALALSAFTMFSTEYFFGLELLRPALLAVIFASSLPAALPRRAALRSMVTRAARWWSPYLVLMLIFVFWRGVIHTFPGKSLTVVTGVESSPLKTLVGLALTVSADFIKSSLASWGQAINVGSLFLGSSSVWLRWLLVCLGVGVLAWFYLLNLKQPEVPSAPVLQGEQKDHWAASAILLGVFAFLVAGWPFWVTGLPMQLGFPQDRYTLPLSVGICLIIAGDH